MGLAGSRSAIPAADETTLGRLRLFFRYDPFLTPDTDFVLWHLAEPVSEKGAEDTRVIAIVLRWFGSGGEVLLWDTEEFTVELGHRYWQPLLIAAPLVPRETRWMRFEIVAKSEIAVVPLATGFVFVSHKERLADHEHFSGSSFRSARYEVLALSRVQDFATELGAGGAPQDAAFNLYAPELAEYADLKPADNPIVVVSVDQTPRARALLFLHWTKAFGTTLASARVPAPDLMAPSLIALPGETWAGDAAVIALDDAGRRLPAHAPLSRWPGPRRRGTTTSRRSRVTAVLTSCRRPELLERTLASFFTYNTYPLDRFIIVEDGPRDANLRAMQRFRERSITWIGTERRAGQIEAIDLAYSLVGTEYIFHLEDDWEFYAPGFIEKSLAVLEAAPACLQVWLRALGDTNLHPVVPGVASFGGVDVQTLALDHLDLWHGFSFNPGLRRTADYRRIGCYSRHVRFDPHHPIRAESGLSKLYRDLGMHAVILADNGGQGYVR
ncbi:MAG: glycosyltransferase, partial [Acetobacteraceae bacterium]|nr:glycosyltransferase [Acetobacteraceae bacterium]